LGGTAKCSHDNGGRGTEFKSAALGDIDVDLDARDAASFAKGVLAHRVQKWP
jgi:hypothetical protein